MDRSTRGTPAPTGDRSLSECHACHRVVDSDAEAPSHAWLARSVAVSGRRGALVIVGLLAVPLFGAPPRAAAQDAPSAGNETQAAQLFDRAARLTERGAPDKAAECLRRLREAHAKTAFVAQREAEIQELEAKVRTALWPGRSRFQGEVLLPAEGVLRIRYAFADPRELADFELLGAAKSPPEIGAGGLAAKRPSEAMLRHAAAFPAEGRFACEVDGVGQGRLVVALAGEGEGIPAEGLAIEVEPAARAVIVRLRRGAAVATEATAARQQGARADAPWLVRVAIAEGRVRAEVTGDGLEPAQVEGDGPSAGAAPFRPGIGFAAGAVRVRGLVIEGPLPAADAVAGPAAAGAGGGAAATPLPRGTWIDLVPAGLDGWRQKDKDAWTSRGGALVQAKERGEVASVELEGRELDAYSLTFEVRALAEGRDARASREPYLAIDLPAGAERVRLRVSARRMELEDQGVGTGGTLPLGEWTQVAVRWDDAGLQVAIGSDTKLVVARKDVLGKSPPGLAFAALAGQRRVEVRGLKLRLDP